MSRKTKWATLATMLVGGATIFQSGCLGGFWNGFFSDGWPADNRWLNLGIDILNEELFG